MSADEAQFDNVLLAVAEKHRGGVPDVSICLNRKHGTKEHGTGYEYLVFQMHI